MSLLQLLRELNYKPMKVGENIYRCYCPLHEDTGTPNFTIYESTNSFYCFACQEGGDEIYFLMKYYNISYQEAIQKNSGNIFKKIVYTNTSREINYNQILNKYASQYFGKLKKYDLNMMKVMEKLDNVLNKNKLTKIEYEYWINKLVKLTSIFCAVKNDV